MGESLPSTIHETLKKNQIEPKMNIQVTFKGALPHPKSLVAPVLGLQAYTTVPFEINPFCKVRQC